MHRNEVDVAVEWAASEGWNPGLYDAGAFFATDPEGFFLGLLDGEPIVSLSAVKYGDAFAFVGLYIVRDDMRGRGYGLRLWQNALSKVSAANLGLDGVPSQVPNYEKSGFLSAYRNIRFGGVVANEQTVDSRLVPLVDVPFEVLAEYDGAHFPVARTSFLRAWIALPESRGLAAIDDGSFRGYGLVRRCREGYKIGPLFADSENVAERLYNSLTQIVETGETVFLDVPEVNDAALRLAERHGMVQSFETVRMYTNGLPEVDLNHVFGATTLELG